MWVLGVEQGNLLQYNLFTYCLNNPVNFVDPSGYLGVPAVAAGGAGALIGGGLLFLCLMGMAIIMGTPSDEAWGVFAQNINILWNATITELETAITVFIPRTTVVPISITREMPQLPPILAARNNNPAPSAPRSPHPPGKRVRHNTRKAAEEAARHAGKGDPKLHSGGKHGSHFHPNVPRGHPRHHDHHYFPRKFG